MVSGAVQGAPTSSTIGTRCGGLTGCATRQRARPFRFSVNRLATIADVDDARIASGAASASSSAKIARLASSVSGTFSCTWLAPSSASATLFAARTRAADPFGSSTSPCCASSSSPSAIRPSALSATPSTASYIAACQPARANTMAQARPIRPDPMMATRGMVSPCCHPFPEGVPFGGGISKITSTISAGAIPDRRAAVSTVRSRSPRRAPGSRCGRRAQARDRGDDRRSPSRPRSASG